MSELGTTLELLITGANGFLFSNLSPLSSLLFVLCSIMAGGLVVTGRTWGKIRMSNSFIGFWRLFAYFMIEVVLITFLPDFLLPTFQNWLKQNSRFLLGTTTAIFGTFFCWFVHTMDYNMKTQGKWIVPTISYLTTLINYTIMQ